MWAEILIGVISAATSGFFSYIFTKKRYEAETKSTEIDNMQKSLIFYEELLNDCQSRLESLLERNKQLQSTIDELQDKILALLNTIRKLEEQLGGKS